jgi:hypothetical protein
LRPDAEYAERLARDRNELVGASDGRRERTGGREPWNFGQAFSPMKRRRPSPSVPPEAAHRSESPALASYREPSWPEGGPRRRDIGFV